MSSSPPPSSERPEAGHTPAEDRTAPEDAAPTLPPLSAPLAGMRPQAQAHTELSEELALLLSRAEQRLTGDSIREEPSPDADAVIEEVDALMSDDALRALEAPLEGIEESEQTGVDEPAEDAPRSVTALEAANENDDDDGSLHTGERRSEAPSPNGTVEATAQRTPVRSSEALNPESATEPVALPDIDLDSSGSQHDSTDPVREIAGNVSPRSQRTPAGGSSSAVPKAASLDDPTDLKLPKRLAEGDAIRALADAVRNRFSGALAFESQAGVRRILLQDGDFTIATSGVEGESLMSFLIARGDVRARDAGLDPRLPAFGRHAGAALIARGYLRQDQLWPALRAYSEWLLGRIVKITAGTMQIEAEITERLAAEPAVFGGVTGAEVLLDTVRRALDPEIALDWLGGRDATVAPEPATALLAECGLSAEETSALTTSLGLSLGQIEQRHARLGGTATSADLLSILFALSVLGVIQVTPARSQALALESSEAKSSLDDAARRAQILARRSLVDEGDYFAILGVPRDATGYDIRRAYLTLRRDLEPRRILSAQTADLADDVTLIVEVLEEAYDVLRDRARRERYRRAIEATSRESADR